MAGGVLGVWTAPAPFLIWEARRGITDDLIAGLACAFLASMLLGSLGGGFGAGYAVSSNHTRGWGLPVGRAAFGGAFIGGAVLSAAACLALLIWNLPR